MRGYGHYFTDVPVRTAVPVRSGLSKSTEQHNAIENAIKQAAGNGPQVIGSDDAVSQPEDVRAIVARVAHDILRNEIDYSYSSVLEYHPSLKGLTLEQINSAIREALR